MKLTRARWKPANEDADLADLVTRIDALDIKRRDEFNAAIWQLWNAFVGEFGGIDAFAEAEPTVRDSYLSQLDKAVERLTPYAASAKGHLYTAVAAFRAYLPGLIVPPTELRRALGAQVVSAIDRARSLGLGGVERSIR